MADEPKDVAEIFRREHALLAEGLEELEARLEDGDWSGARAAAARVDEVGGLLMRFEEEDLYPLLRKILGETRVDRLYHDHGPGLEVVRTLLGTREGASLSEVRRQELLDQLSSMVRHVEECGRLASVLDELPSGEREHLVGRIRGYREDPMRWSEWMRQRERRELRSHDY